MSEPGSMEALRRESTVPDVDPAATVQYRAGDPAPPPLKPFTESELIEMWGGKTEPVASILCPTYNHRAFIADALDGCLGQVTDFPFEVVVRDDASTDGTADVLRDYARRYPQTVRAILEPANTFSRGVSFIPALARSSRGAFIAFCAGDDYWIHSQKLSRQIHALSHDRAAAAVHHEACSIRSDSVLGCPINSLKAQATISANDLSRGVMAMPVTLCVRRSAVDLTAPEFDHITNEDNLIFTQVSRHGHSVYLPEIMATYRVHDDSLWNSKSERHKQVEVLNSFLWISRYHFRTGSASIGRRYAMWAGLKMQSQLASCGPSVASWATLAIAGKWLKTKLTPGRRSSDQPA